MRVFRAGYTDKSGQKRQAQKWYIELRDHLDTVRRIPGFTDKRQTENLGRQIEKLVRSKVAGEKPDTELSRWLENIPERLRKNLVRIGLIDPQRAAAGKILKKHLDDFRACLQAKGNTQQYVNLVTLRATRVIEGCHFINWSDISASKVQRYLAGLREGESGISNQTFNFYLQAIKQFCRWMVQDRRASENPLVHLKGLNVRTDRRHDRRALEPEELRRLLETTRKGPERYGMNGSERAALYRLAAESGLRSGELAKLKVKSFDLDGGTVTVQAAYSKRRRQDTLPLRIDTAKELKAVLSGKLPETAAFNMPPKWNVVKMLKADLSDAKIYYVDESGRYADFHSLRHTTGSLLAASGANPKVAQTIMRHSDINLTLSRYSHIYKGQESAAVAGLPDLSQPSKYSQQAQATGTNGTEIVSNNPQKNLASSLALSCGKQGISMGADGQFDNKMESHNHSKKPAESKESGFIGQKTSLDSTAPGRTRTCGLRFRKPSLYPG